MAQASQNQQRVIPQSKEALLKSYQKRLKDGIKSMTDHFLEIIKLAKVCVSCICDTLQKVRIESYKSN